MSQPVAHPEATPNGAGRTYTLRDTRAFPYWGVRCSPSGSKSSGNSAPSSLVSISAPCRMEETQEARGARALWRSVS
jgi:hypothetical protein